VLSDIRGNFQTSKQPGHDRRGHINAASARILRFAAGVTLII